MTAFNSQFAIGQTITDSQSVDITTSLFAIDISPSYIKAVREDLKDSVIVFNHFFSSLH